MAIYTELTKDSFPSIHITGYHVHAYLSPVKDPETKSQTYSAWMYEPITESATLISTEETPEEAFTVARGALIARAEADGIDPHEGE